MIKDDYIIEGIVSTLIATEPMSFGDHVDYAYSGDRTKIKKNGSYPFTDHNYAGRVLDHVKKGEGVSVLLQGHIIPKARETEYREQMRHELMLSVFSCIGGMFGYDVEVKKITVESK